MKERPILFSAPMVRALLAGTKTQTRRAVKPQPPGLMPPGWGFVRDVGTWHAAHGAYRGANIGRCRYGVPGDRLWVRETFQPLLAPGVEHWDADWQTGKGYAPRYVATDGRVEWIDAEDNMSDRCMPGIHMPRWASRITLEVTGMRVERLQDISEADARTEGSPCVDEASGREVLFPDASKCGTFKLGYRHVWEQINGGGSWDANPWVWVVEFRRVAP